MDKGIQYRVHYAPEMCAFCIGNGTGRCRDGEIHERCPVCQGFGSLLVAQPGKKCGFCKGEGGGDCRDGYYYDACPICKGAGWSFALFSE